MTAITFWFIIALVAGFLVVNSSNQNTHMNPNQNRFQPYPPGMGMGHDYDRDYYRFVREREYRRLIATLVFIVVLVVAFALLANAA